MLRWRPKCAGESPWLANPGHQHSSGRNVRLHQEIDDVFPGSISIPNTYNRLGLLIDWVEKEVAPPMSVVVTGGEPQSSDVFLSGVSKIYRRASRPCRFLYMCGEVNPHNQDSVDRCCIPGSEDFMRNRKYRVGMVALSFSLLLSVCPVYGADDPPQGPANQSLQAQHVFDANVTIAEMLNFGKSKYGERRIIPITGGTFKGPNIEGVVLPGGADWQLVRPDGDVELYARYTLKTTDGSLIQMTNRVLIHTPPKDSKTGPYIRSVIDFEAPSTSPYDWLNHAIFWGTLTVPQQLPKDKPYVIIGAYKVL